MIIAGFDKQSLIDYPGNISAVIFTQGCNFHCPYCHNSQLIARKGDASLPWEYVEQYLLKNRTLLDAVVITGGEPTLQSDLPEFIAKIREINLKVKLDTNGSNPEMLSSLIDSGAIDFVAMDIKSELTAEAYSRASGIRFDKPHLEKILCSINKIISSGIPHQFRTTWSHRLISPENIDAIKDFFAALKDETFIVQRCIEEG